MNQWIKRGLMMFTPVLVFSLYAAPTWAAGNYYVNANNVNKDDNNSCRTKSAPCATMAGVITKILDSSNPADSTILARGTFTEQVDINDPDLDGLTINWLRQGHKPVIDATGNSYGIYVSAVDDVTINHVIVKQANSYGIFFSGSSNSHIQGGTVKRSRVHDLSNTTTSHYGIYFSRVDDGLISRNHIDHIGSNSTNLDTYPDSYGILVTNSNRPYILHNTVRDFSVTTTYTDETSYTYAIVEGIYVYEADQAQVKYNVIKDLSASSNNDFTSGYTYAYGYGIYFYNCLNSLFSGNVIRRMSAESSASQDGVTATAYNYGIYGSGSDGVTFRHNTLVGNTASSGVMDDESNSSGIYGLYADGFGNVNIIHNIVKNNTATSTNGSGSTKIYAIILNDLSAPLVQNNIVKNNTANTLQDGNASSFGIYLTDAAQANLIHNRLSNFIANINDSTYTAQSVGITLGYDASADVLNNLVYFTSPLVKDDITGVSVLSAQADPVRALFNTFSNMRTCLNITEASEIDFQNNVCRLGTSGAFGISLDSDEYDVSQLTSDYNIFFNSEEPLLMNDDATGTLAFSDWKSGQYDQDQNSLKSNPLLRLAHPNKRGYLHLKPSSLAINAGTNAADFGGDDLMNALLLLDWDKDARPQGATVDIGADEFTL